MKRLLALILAVAMVLSCFAACGDTNDTPSTDGDDSSNNGTVDDSGDSAEENLVNPWGDVNLFDDDGEIDLVAFTELSDTIYEAVLGDYVEAYHTAADSDNLSERYALFAVAEAKLLEAAALLPGINYGTNYQITSVVPRTVSTIQYGMVADRSYTALVLNEQLYASDRAYLVDLWNEVKGTGTYKELAKEYLTGQGYTFKDSLTTMYSSEPTTFDDLVSARTSDHDVLIYGIDPLLMYDDENVLQPALATGYDVSDDGLTYTFYIREGVTWVDQQGRAVADLVADDWVAGLQHLLDAKGGTEFLLEGVVAGVSEYLSGEITDFSQVGIEAVDDHTLVYTLEAPCAYFLTMLDYNIFYPMSRSYYESMGGKFGADFDSAAEDYIYGTSPETIAYCGAYTITNHTSENIFVFTANESYWNYDNLANKTVTWLFNDGTDALKSYNNYISGVTDNAGLSATALEQALADGYSTDDYMYIAEVSSASSYPIFFNLYRIATANFNDSTAAVSTLDETELLRTNIAMSNVHFRNAILMGWDRENYIALSVGTEFALDSLANSYTPGTFVEIPEAVTIEINGEATTFEAGTYYGEILQAQLDADEMGVKVWDDELKSSYGFDGWYNPEKAVEELKLALEELAEYGLVVTEDHPIIIEADYVAGAQTNTNMMNELKQTIEESLGGLVQVNLIECADSSERLYATYYFDAGYDANYTINTSIGWGPDYGDPSTYLATMVEDADGYMLHCCGIYGY